MRSVTGAGNSRGAGSYTPVQPERAAESQQGAAQGLSTCSKIGIGSLAVFLLGVNEVFFSFPRCVDGDSAGTLVSTYRISPDQSSELLKLSDQGYLVKTGSGFEASEKLFEAIHQEDPGTDLVNSLIAAGINPDPNGFTSEHCKYTLGEVFGQIATGHSDITCPPYRGSTIKNTTCQGGDGTGGEETEPEHYWIT